MSAYRSIRRFRASASFRSWLLRIVTNESRDRLRSSHTQNGLGALLDRERPLVDPFPMPETSALETEPRRYLLAAVRRLNEADQRVI